MPRIKTRSIDRKILYLRIGCVIVKVDPQEFDYVMYVDASGDDGFKFDHQSSICYAAAALLVKQEDIAHNLDILSQIKAILGCKPTDEIKYSKVRRHRHGKEALSLLSNIRGSLSCHVVFKKEVDASQYIGNKIMSVVCHCMALASLDAYSFSDGEKILVSIDRMKQTEEQPIKWILDDTSEKKPRGFDVSVVFRDSKDANFLLIQIADLLCGSIREHFEQYETQEDMIYFSQKRPLCKKVAEIKKSRSRPLCKKGKSRMEKIISSQAFKPIYPLFPVRKAAGMIDYFFMEPPYMMDRHFYMICTRKK